MGLEYDLDQLTVLTTEKRNAASNNIDRLSTEEIVRLIAAEDSKVVEAVAQAVPQIVQAADLITAAFKRGGRLIYTGSGTSGRLGILDAAELLPTFGVGDDKVKAIIAGGRAAVFSPVEKAEDDYEAGIKDVEAVGLNSKDVVVGISASGRTPYVLGTLHGAEKAGASTIALVCNSPSAMEGAAQVAIAVIVGPEIIAGSTRMKAGTAQKMVLNMLSTTVMIKLGKVYQNFMVDMIPTNMKLKKRAQHIVVETTGVSQEKAWEYLEAAQWNIKAAIVMAQANCTIERALDLLDKGEGVVGRALELAGV